MSRVQTRRCISVSSGAGARFAAAAAARGIGLSRLVELALAESLPPVAASPAGDAEAFHRAVRTTGVTL